MYLAIDVGATKTLLAVFSEDGKLLYEQKIATNHKYDRFLADLRSALETDDFKSLKISAVCCALPGRLDRVNGIGLRFGNLGWEKVPIRKDLQKIFRGIEIFIENDAKLAGLYEARLLLKKYKKVVYLTISTGIGIGIIVDGKIDPALADAEIGNMVVEHEGKLRRWEDFASGKALVERYGKRAEQLKGELQKRQNSMVPIPPIIKAKEAQEAVIYGCYEFIKQNVG